MPYSVIPPYILRNIIDNCSGLPQVSARRTLTHVQQLMAEHTHPASAADIAQPGHVLRAIFDAGQSQTLPGNLVRREGEASNGDIAADEAWNYLGVTYAFFWQIYQRNSLDNQGLKLDGTVHYGKAYQNAFWNGQQMVFGDGDGEIFNRFTIAIDVVAHELTHGVTESEAGLIYFQQAGALNESMSDVFGSLVKQFYHQQRADEADWIIGEGLLASGINGSGLRSMSAPGTAYDDPLLGKDPQPADMAHYIDTREDNGGVHLNSGIPNRAFYLAATALGGFAWERAGQAWYDALCDKTLPQNADFSTFAGYTVQHAARRFDQQVAEQIRAAWQKVGVE